MKLLCLGAAAVLSSSAVAAAAPIASLYDTGVDAAGAVLPVGSVDSHYLVDGTGASYVFTNPNYFMASDAAFIGVAPDGSYTTSVNTFTLKFALSSAQAATAAISGLFSADNFATAYLNGAQIAQDAQDSDSANYGQETAFAATSGFIVGLNTLSFTVTDTGPPSGLEVSGLTGAYTPVSAAPEPASWALMLAGMGVVGATMRAQPRRAALAPT